MIRQLSSDLHHIRPSYPCYWSTNGWEYPYTQNIPDFVFLVTGDTWRGVSSAGVRCQLRWCQVLVSGHQVRVGWPPCVCLCWLITHQSCYNSQQSQENVVKNMSWSRVSVLSLSWVGISEPGKQRQTANVANWVENCNVYTKYCQNCQIMPPSEDCLNNFWGLCDHRQIGRNLSIDEPTSNYCQFSRWMIFCQDAKMFYIELWTGISPNMLDYGSM